MRFDNKDIGLFSDEASEDNKPKKKSKKKLNEGFSWLLTAGAVYSFYKFIQGLRRKGEPSEAEKNYGKSDWRSLNVYVRDYLKQGGKVQYEENHWFHVFEVGDLTIKIDKQNKTVFWTHIVPDIKRFLKYKTDKRIELTDIGEDEHEYTIPIPISQSDIDSLVDAIKQDLDESKEIKTKKKIKITEAQFDRLFTEDYYDSRKEVDGYVDGDDLVGQHLWFHTNRTHRNNGWNGMIGIYKSTKRGRKAGSPLYYTNEIRLQSPIYFQTSEKGAEGIKQSGRRTLIAGVSGIVIPTEGGLDGFEEISYSPFDPGYFYKIGDDELKEIVGANEVYFKATEDGQWVIMAKDIVYNEDSLNENHVPTQKPTFEDIYNSFYDKMFSQLCRKYTNDNDKAQEYCQEGFVKVWKNFDKYDGRGSMEGWVRYVIKNTILDIIRKESKMKYADTGEEPFDFEGMGRREEDKPLEMSKSMDDVINAMSQLPKQYRKVFSLYYLDGLTHQEIAKELGISEGTSKSNLSKAKKKIQNILGKELYTEEEEGGDTGGSSTPSGGGSYWETGVTRGPANTLGNSVWSPKATNYKSITRGPANPLW